MSVLPVLALKELHRLGELHRRSSSRTALPSRMAETHYSGVRVPDVKREIRVKIASRQSEWDQAFQLVTDNYLRCGYEASAPGQLRYTPYHTLPDTIVIVAKEGEQVLYTMTLVFDNVLLGLPIESLYHAEIDKMRAEGCQLVEVTCLADHNLTFREFTPVFTTVVRLAMQYAMAQGGESWVISINPKHRRFYQKILGFVPFGPVRSYPSVQNHPAEAFRLDKTLMKNNAPAMYDAVFGDPLGWDALSAEAMAPEPIRHYSQHSSQVTEQEADDILEWVDQFGSPRRW